VYQALGEKQKAIDFYNQALPICRAVGSRAGEATTLNNLGMAYDDLGERQKALDYLAQALTLERAVGSRAGEATALNNLGLVYSHLGEMQKAVDYYSQALPLQRAVGDRTGEARTLNNIGAVYEAWGEKQKALDYYNQALPLWRAVGNRAGEAATLDNIGKVYDALGEKQNALDHYNQALPIWRALGDRSGEAVALTCIGKVYSDLGEKRKTLEYLSQALTLQRAVGDRAGQAVTLNNIGTLYSDVGDKQKALEYYSQALPLTRAVGDRAGEAMTLRNIGASYGLMGERQNALDYYNQALPLQRAVGNRAGEAMTLSGIGTVYNDLGEQQKALDYYNQALPITRAVGDRAGEADILGNMAFVERDRGNLPQARAHVEGALEIIESLRAKVGSQELRASYFATVQGYYPFYIDLLMRLHGQHPKEGYDSRALEASERGRARSLLETLAEARADIRQGIDPQLLSQERTLQQLLDSKSARFTRLMNGPHTAEQAETAKKEIDDLLSQSDDLEVKIRNASPHYAALTQPQPLSAEAIQQQLLDSDTLLLEYALGAEQSYLWAVEPDSLTTYVLPKELEIKSRVRDLYPMLRRASPLPADQIHKVAAQFSQMVLGPVASKLGRKRLAIVADGALSYIPFGALPAPSDPDALGPQPPLVIDHEIVYLPSASTLAVLRRDIENRQSAAKLVAVLADPVFSTSDERVKSKVVSPNGVAGSGSASAGREPQRQNLEAEIFQSKFVRSAQDSGIMRDGGWVRLKFTRKEAESIVALVPEDLRLENLDFAASKISAASPTLAQYRMVHFATHGLLDSERPDLSGVVLSLVDEQGSQRDGFLRLHDVFNLNLAADLVVLSACQTGLGKEVRGEGLVSLTRGFMYAGAPRVVVSLWSVSDPATAELMRRFYEAMLKDRQRPVQALRTAQTSMTNDPRWSAPCYWAAFVLQGEWR
jgi:CHAT domain-containing protein/Tfp pilus assembly protein PilF